MTDTSSEPDVARQAGRGFLFISGAKLYFLLTATLTSLALPRLFGDPILFGRYRVVSGLLNVVTMVVITATVQSVSKLTSETGAGVQSVRRSAIIVQTLLFGPIFLAMFLFAEEIAGGLLADPSLGTPLRVASLVVIAYAFYAVLVGTLNGTRRFGHQAALDVSYSTVKTGLMLVLVVVTGSVTWAFGGFAIAAFLVLGLALFTARIGQDGGESRPVKGRYLRFLLPLGGYALVLNLLLQADIIGIKAALGGGLETLWNETTTADRASAAAGVFGAVKNVATIPYQAVISLTFVVFPLVSRATSSPDAGAADATIGGAMRLAAVLAFGSVAVLGSTGDGLLVLLFGSPYAGGGQILVLLLVAISLMAMMFVGNAILAASGRPTVSLLCGAAAVVVQAGLLATLLPGVTDPSSAWTLAAGSTAAGCACGAGISLFRLRMVFPAVVWIRTVVTATAGALAAIVLDTAVFISLPWPARSLIAGLVFLVILMGTGAVSTGDLGRVAGLLRRLGPGR